MKADSGSHDIMFRMKMTQGKKAKMVMQAPDLSISKANQEKAQKLYSNFVIAIKRQLDSVKSEFSTFKTLLRTIKSEKKDPAEPQILEVIRRMQKDKLHAQVAFQLSEMASANLQNMQKTMIVKMIPYFIGLLGVLISVFLVAMERPFEVTNPQLQRDLMIFVPMLLVFVWGLRQRAAMKFDMLALNIMFQASSAYGSAKIQGKGEIAAMQNLAEMKRRAASMEEKEKSKGKKEKKKKPKK